MILHGLRLIGGNRDNRGPAGEDRHFRLMLAALDRATASGLKNHGIKRSRDMASRSVYLHLHDNAGRLWRLRVSDHRKPERIMAAHFDLQSLDGLFGRDDLVAFIDKIADGTAAWFDPMKTRRRVSPRLKGLISRRRQK